MSYGFVSLIISDTPVDQLQSITNHSDKNEGNKNHWAISLHLK